MINMDVEKLKRKIEEGGALYIPMYVSKRVKDYISDFEGGCSKDAIDEAWKELKRSYGERPGGIVPVDLYRDNCHRIAYLRYYFFLNYPAIKWILLKNLENNKKIIPEVDSVKILDYGAGPGTASMAVCDFLEDAKEIGMYENTRVKLYFDEKCGDFGKCYREMLKTPARVESVNYVHDGRQNWYKKSFFDMIILSYVLNELGERDHERLILNSCNCLRDNGFLVILESAYEDVRKYVDGFLKNSAIRASFKMFDASGPFCSEKDCDQWGKCYDKSIKRKKLKTPREMTEEMKRFFEDEKVKDNRTKWVYVILKKTKVQEELEDLSRLNESEDCSGRIIKLSGWVIEKKSTMDAENITLCNGSKRCNLTFWKKSERVFKRVPDISMGDMLCVEGKLLVKSFLGLRSISVTKIVEHLKRID